MSLKKNIAANYASQIYVTFIGIVILPLYIKYMGAEAYGLVGFFAMLQVWFNLLDMGLTPTIARETARFRGGGLDARTFRQLVRALEGIFFSIACVGGVALFFGSKYIANDWLKASSLPLNEVENAIQLMAIIIAMRWMCGLYRGVVSGSEKLVWLGAFNALIATFRFVVVLPILFFVSASPTTFFSYQLLVAVFELLGLIVYSYRLLPAVEGKIIFFAWSPIKPILKFSLTIAFTSSVWILVTQTDKLVLSKILPLGEYGYFTLAVLVASAVLMISVPISRAIMPRMAKLETEGEHKQLLLVYRKATQLVAVLASSVSIMMLLYAEPLLFAWTGDALLAHQASPVLGLYAFGNGILAVSAFPYYLQYAKGDLRLHFIGNVIFVVLLIPLVIWAANQYGGIGAGYVWLGMNIFTFVVWLPLIHRKFAPGLNRIWYFNDVLPIYLSASAAGVILSESVALVSEGYWTFLEMIGLGLLVMLAAICASSDARASYSKLMNQRHKGGSC